MKMQKRKAVRIVAYLNDFDSNGNKWRDSFYELWRYQMTWGFAYSINLYESRQKGVYVCMDVKTEYKKDALATMEDLGYKRVSAQDVTGGIFDSWDMDVDFVAED